MDWIISNLNEIVGVLTKAVALAAAISAVTPGTGDNKIVSFLLKIVNVIGLNVGKAKNATDA